MNSGRCGRATLSDVAAYAGVSPSTVSRVVRNATPVSAPLARPTVGAIEGHDERSSVIMPTHLVVRSSA